MIAPIAGSSAAARTVATGGVLAPSAAAKPSGKSFAGELAKLATASDATTAKVPARPDGEQTTKIAGHPYSRIENGDDKGLYLNQLTGSPRLGTVFRLVKRDDRVFHVYGDGKDKLVVEIKARATSDSTSAQSVRGTVPAAT